MSSGRPRAIAAKQKAAADRADHAIMPTKKKPGNQFGTEYILRAETKKG